MSKAYSQKPFDKSRPIHLPPLREVRCHFCSRRFSGRIPGELAEQIFAHVESAHPDHTVPLTDVDTFLFKAASRGLSVLPWEDD
jgi:hypothetical protein